MQRYNPLWESVRRVIESRVLGECLHGWFENYAADEGLGPEHWFWDRAKSGGIFIERGVHFSDLFEGWLGPGEVVAAQRVLRLVTGIEEQVQCTVRPASGPLVNFHHSFTQPGRLDRQEFRLLFERGDIADEAQTRMLLEIFPGARLDVLKPTPARNGREKGRKLRTVPPHSKRTFNSKTGSVHDLVVTA